MKRCVFSSHPEREREREREGDREREREREREGETERERERERRDGNELMGGFLGGPSFGAASRWPGVYLLVRAVRVSD